MAIEIMSDASLDKILLHDINMQFPRSLDLSGGNAEKGCELQVRILVINTVGLKYEGITSVILNYLNAMDRDGLCIDVLAFEGIEEELENQFSRIAHLIFVPWRKKHVVKYIWDLYHVLRSNQYDVIHINGNSATMAIESLLAKLCKVKKVIVHSHNTRCNHEVLNRILKPIMDATSDVRLACSTAAGEWLFQNNEFEVLNNAIDTARFSFDEAKRAISRQKLGIGDEYVIGHIGHFTEQKNHSFLIDVFDRVHKANVNTKLLLVSDGPAFESMKLKAASLNLTDSVIFAGRRSDPEVLYQAMDVFVFPSKWEGLGLVLIEAQSSGLPCIASSMVPDAGNVTGNVQFLSLDEMDKWVGWLLENAEAEKSSRKKASEKNVYAIKNKGYDIQSAAERLRNLYLA